MASTTKVSEGSLDSAGVAVPIRRLIKIVSILKAVAVIRIVWGSKQSFAMKSFLLLYTGKRDYSCDGSNCLYLAMSTEILNISCFP